MAWWRRTESAAWLLAAVVAGCASSPVSGVRYVNRDPVWRVADERPIEKPAEREEPKGLSGNVEDLIRRPLLHYMSVPEPKRAQNVSSIGEVPDSTWFENRIGVRDMSAADIAEGPNHLGGPDPSAPWKVVSGKSAGAAPGVMIEDARGDRYLLKFDPQKTPELETAGDVVVQRLLWAIGYHVPQDSVVRFDRDQLVVAEGAERKTKEGEKLPLTEADLDELLSQVAPPADGEGFRGLASKLIEGEPIGGYAMTGTRPDDPNDRVPHEHRRDVRGQWVFFAWLKHTDIKENNTLDVWVEDPEGSGRGHVVHYLIDFGKALGGKGYDGASPQDGWAYWFDYEYTIYSTLTFGLWKRPWERIPASPLAGVGRYQAERYEPDHFRTTRPFAPFLWMDRFDAYWAAKILARFEPAHIAAAVRQGRYSDPRAERYLTRTIVARQRKTVRFWFSEVNPVDRFRVEPAPEGQGWRLCAEDLLLAHDLGSVEGSRYALSAWDWDGAPLGWRRELEASPDGRVCASGLKAPASHEGYVIVRWVTRRDGETLPPTEVHLARRDGGAGALRVVGVRRR